MIIYIYFLLIILLISSQPNEYTLPIPIWGSGTRVNWIWGVGYGHTVGKLYYPSALSCCYPNTRVTLLHIYYVPTYLLPTFCMLVLRLKPGDTVRSKWSELWSANLKLSLKVSVEAHFEISCYIFIPFLNIDWQNEIF